MACHLENRVKRALIMAEGREIMASDLDLDGGDGGDNFLNLRAAREDAERRAIGRALVAQEGNVSAAARQLGISRPTLYDLMRQHGISA